MVPPFRSTRTVAWRVLERPKSASGMSRTRCITSAPLTAPIGTLWVRVLPSRLRVRRSAGFFPSGSALGQSAIEIGPLGSAS